MKETLASLLKPFADFCFEALNAIPLTGARIIFILVMAALAFWITTFKDENPKNLPEYSGKPSGFLLFHDLRFWAVCILVLQIVLVIVFK